MHRNVAIPVASAGGSCSPSGRPLISGLAIYLNAFGVKAVCPTPPSTRRSRTGSPRSCSSALALALGAGARGAVAGQRNWLGLVAVGVIGGSIPFVLFFSGLAMATAPSAAFIQKTMFIWVALMAVPFLGERLGFAQLGALGTLLVGQALIAPPTGMGWGAGETMIAVATLLWAVEMVLAKRLLTSISTPVMAAARLGLGLVILVGYLAVSGKLGGLGGLRQVQWGWALLTGLVLAGYVATWFGALRLAPATTVTSVLVVAAVLTGILTAVNKGMAPSPKVVGGYLLIVIAAGMLGWWSIRTARRSTVAATVAAS